MKVNDELLISALKICNENAMNGIPDIIDRHDFSHKFERKIERINRANKKFHGNLKIERIVRYTTGIAAVLICSIVLNGLVIRAFHVNLWNTAYNKVGEFLNIGFVPEIESETVNSIDTKLKMVSVPDGYKKQEEYFSENISVQNFRANQGTITYTEGLITDSADVNILSESTEGKNVIVGAKDVLLICGKDNITAFFKDNKYYHMVEVQGTDANENFVIDIIKKLEAQ